MSPKNKIGIIAHDNFMFKNDPPYPRPMFLSYENPMRIKSILDHFSAINLFSDECIYKISPEMISDDVLQLTHSKYLINLIKRLSRYGSGLLGEEIYITGDTFRLAKRAVAGAIKALTCVVNGEMNQTIALIRPPGHHAARDKSSGLCIFNNIATAICYLRKRLGFDKKIAIIDIDDHFGDGLAQYFYEDPSVLYFSIHEYDFIEGDLGDYTEIGEGKGKGTNINFPVPLGITDGDLLECSTILSPILSQFQPELIVVALGFDFHYSDPIGNGHLTTHGYYQFTQLMKDIAEEACSGKISFILEGGYSLIALPYCVHSVIQALLEQSHVRPSFEFQDFSEFSRIEEIKKVKSILKKIMSNYWNL